MIPANQIKTGMFIKQDLRLCAILGYSHTKPGKGGAFLRMRIKDIVTGQVLEKTISTAEKVDNVFVEERKLNYLYRDSAGFHFMDETTYEDIEMSEDKVSDVMQFVKENDPVYATVYEGKIVSLSSPLFVELKIIETDPGFKGDTVKSGSKSAKLETGVIVSVPLFINNGDTIKIDTRTGEYVERV